MKYLLIISAVMLSSLSMQAQRNTKDRNGTQSIDKKLNLTTSQEVKVNEIRKETREKVNVIRNDKKLSDDEKKVKLRTVVKEGQLKKKEVLTPSQQKIMSDEMKNRR